MNFIFLRRVMEVWMQWVPCKVYFAQDPLRSYVHDPQKNEIYFLTVDVLALLTWVPSSENVSSEVCDRVTFKPACSAT